MGLRKSLLAKLPGSLSERKRVADKISPAKHVVAAGKFVRDAGSTPAASTILRSERASVSSEHYLRSRLCQKYCGSFEAQDGSGQF